MGNIAFVGISEMKIARSPDMLEAQGLGSCVAIVIYDSFKKMAGMIHAMLPTIKNATRNAKMIRSKYVDSAIEDLIFEMQKNGSKKNELKAKLTGGANMFPAVSLSGDSIGKRNTDMAKSKLVDEDIELVAEDIGGTSGRTVRFIVETNKFIIKTAFENTKEI